MSRAEASHHPAAAAPTAGVMVIDGFLPADLALEMRRDIERHFAEPAAHRPDTHQVWNYWFIPELYTYLRTDPRKIIAAARVEDFQNALRDWSVGMLGMADISPPHLSLYVGGCRQAWHNDALNGRFGFVYSLTRDDRRTLGGETLIWRESDPYRANFAAAAAGRDFHDAIAPRFNRLVIFDDRLPHAVAPIEGSMDPVEGRLVIHGHLSEGGTVVEGPLPEDRIAEPLVAMLRRFGEEQSAETALYHGPLVVRLRISTEGKVTASEVIVDRVLHLDPGHVEWQPLRAKLIDRFRRLRFPPADGETLLIQPVLFGNLIREP